MGLLCWDAWELLVPPKDSCGSLLRDEWLLRSWVRAAPWGRRTGFLRPPHPLYLQCSTRPLSPKPGFWRWEGVADGGRWVALSAPRPGHRKEPARRRWVEHMGLGGGSEIGVWSRLWAFGFSLPPGSCGVLETGSLFLKWLDLSSQFPQWSRTSRHHL